QLIAGTIPAAPTRDSLRFSNRPVSHAAMPAASAGTHRLFAIVPVPTRAFVQAGSSTKQTAGQSGAAPQVRNSADSIETRDRWRVVGATSYSAGDRTSAVTTFAGGAPVDRGGVTEAAVTGAPSQPAPGAASANARWPTITITRPGFAAPSTS